MKTFRKLIDEINEINFLSLATPSNYNIPYQILDAERQEQNLWRLPCTHLINPPISEKQLEKFKDDISLLGLANAPQLEAFLASSNGAEFFRLQYIWQDKTSYWNPRYRILNCDEIILVNKYLLELFKGYAEFDQDLSEKVESLSLDYLVFCDVSDGNYLAFNQTDNTNSVIFYDKDYGPYPYSNERAREGYTPVADSLEDWLQDLIVYRGRAGMGEHFIPL